ncbi:diguanylate cyclase, partial [Chloroflexota bacterium]
HHNIVQLVTFIIYVILILIVLRNGRSKQKDLFLIYLLASAGWSFTSFMGNSSGIPASQVLGWARTVAVFASWAVVAYGYFIAVYVRKNVGLVAKAGYGYLLFMIVLTATGLLHQNFAVIDGVAIKDYGIGIIPLSVGNAIFIINSYFLLFRSYRSSTDPDHRNRLIYLLSGLTLLVVMGATWALKPQWSSVDHVGHMGNALLISYAILRYRLLDMKLILRKTIVYTGVSAFVSTCCLLLITKWTYLVGSWPAPASLSTTIVVVVAMFATIKPLRDVLEKATNHLFYGKSYNYRQTLLSLSSKMSNIIDLDQLAEAILSPLTNAVRANQASLLFTTNGHFTSQFAERYTKSEPVTPIALRRDGPVIAWLERESQPLNANIINREVEFKSMWEEERNSLAAAEVEVLCPIKSKNKLVAILALSKKHGRSYYSRDDIDLLMTLANEAAVAIENAELYQKARERANTDELTGLFNHRFFHQRLDEEIARSSRFGEVFSLILLDIDHFKKYNDVYGHLAGDVVLKKVGSHIKHELRDTDICFRYGGDEFAILLPETPMESGKIVAERVRKVIESHSDWQGLPITISIGIASWPTDGVMKEELIQSSDAALYYAKQSGKNRACLACEVALSEVLRIDPDKGRMGSEAILSTIYALAATVDAKDHYTYGHSKKVCQYATDIAEAMDYKLDGVERIRAAALLHDIGKIGVSDRLLQKKDALTPDEWELIQAHPNLGVAIIKHIDSLRDCLAAVQYHHEHYNGAGYPAGLSGQNIPLDARILSVADAFDAMTSQRPYRKKLGFGEALEELKRCSGTQFDPAIVETFVRLSEESGLLSKSPEEIL